jgi:antitoxin YefM
MLEITYAKLQEDFASVMERVIIDREVVTVRGIARHREALRRKGDQRVAMVPADELSSLLETANLLRSPRNADRLLKALRRTNRRKIEPEYLDELRQQIGLARSR